MPDSPAEQELVAKFVQAFQSGDVDALVALLTADVRLSTPPIPLEYHGLDAVTGFYAAVFQVAGHYDLVPTRANGQPAFGAYIHDVTGGMRHGAGLLVLTCAGKRIGVLTRFDNNVLATFGLPRPLPG
jgi:ketosteroid isomerase-like protein